MSKLSDFFSMSKQERRGAWMIVALIVILVAAVFIERKCSSENVDPTTQKEINEYVEKAKKTKVKDKKDSKKAAKKTSSSNKSKSQSKKSSSSNKSASKSKSDSKKSTKKDNKSSKGKTSKSKKSSSANRLLDPVPQF